MMLKILNILIRWELQKQLSLPALGFLIASAIIVVLTQANPSILPERNFVGLYSSSTTIFVIFNVIGSAFFSRSFAGGIGKNEFKLLLSYPVKRSQIFFSKYIVMFATIFIIYSAVFILNIYLNLLSPFEPLFYLSLLFFALHLLVVCGIASVISIVTKNEVMSAMASILLLLGLESMTGPSLFSSQGRFMYIFQYFGEITRGFRPFGDQFIVTSTDALMAILIPIIVFSVLFILSFVYVTRSMEFD